MVRKFEATGSAWSVWRVNQAARNLLESQTRPLWVVGELSAWTRSSRGHRYFTLKDAKAELRCVLFAGDAWRLPTDPKEGSHLRAFGQLTVYPARGSFQLVAKKVEAEGGEGLWRMAFNRLRRLLDDEGLLDPARKRPLPERPRRVAVVTSASGAALQDVVAVIARRAPWVRLVVSPASVQGEGAARKIRTAIELAGRADPDLIIVCRGGGGAEDLWAFNQEETARAIAESPVPVVTGIGHEVDRTIADLVADRAAPTPSAAAEMAVPEVGAVLSRVEDLRSALPASLLGQVRARRSRLEELAVSLYGSGERLIGLLRMDIDRALAELVGGARDAVRERRLSLAGYAAGLGALSPLATLERGYSIATGRDGTALRRRADLPAGKEFLLRVSDGEVECRATGG